MAGLAQARRDVAPAPAAVPGAVDQDEGAPVARPVRQPVTTYLENTGTTPLRFQNLHEQFDVRRSWGKGNCPVARAHSPL